MAKHGAGLAEKNSVANIIILRLAKSFLAQKTIMMELAVEGNLGSKKKTIVQEDILDIAESDGSSGFLFEAN